MIAQEHDLSIGQPYAFKKRIAISEGTVLKGNKWFVQTNQMTVEYAVITFQSNEGKQISRNLSSIYRAYVVNLITCSS